MSNTDGGGSYLKDFHFNLIEECSFYHNEEPPGITLEKKKNNDYGGTESVFAFKVRVKSSTEEVHAMSDNFDPIIPPIHSVRTAYISTV
jgi:hypothetical protein